MHASLPQLAEEKGGEGEGGEAAGEAARGVAERGLRGERGELVEELQRADGDLRDRERRRPRHKHGICTTAQAASGRARDFKRRPD